MEIAGGHHQICHLKKPAKTTSDKANSGYMAFWSDFEGSGPKSTSYNGIAL